MTASEPVTVLVPTVGRPGLLAECLASVRAAQPSAAQVLIVDQSGTGAAAAQAAEVGLEATIVEMQRAGVGAAMNAGLRAAAHDAVLVTHDDCRVAPDWVGVGARLLRARPADLHTGRVLPEEGAGHVPSTITSHEPAVYRGAPRADVLYPNCMALSARAACRLGGFDPRIAMAEDNDFCFRWMAAGGTVRYGPELTVWHGDWRTPAQLRDLYRGYWDSQGEVIGKHLARRDRRILSVLCGNVAWAARGTVQRRRSLRPIDVPDPTYAALTRLPVGMARGWARELRSARPEKPLEPVG